MIWFNVRAALEQLEKEGEVYTLRPLPKRPGVHPMFSTLRTPRYRGTVRVEFIGIVTLEDLKAYVAKSGFPSAEKWWQAAKSSSFLHYVTWEKRRRGNGSTQAF